MSINPAEATLDDIRRASRQFAPDILKLSTKYYPLALAPGGPTAAQEAELAATCRGLLPDFLDAALLRPGGLTKTTPMAGQVDLFAVLGATGLDLGTLISTILGEAITSKDWAQRLATVDLSDAVAQ